ncbi:sporulation killing factor system radical SAM maturase [Peribacillus castrilensis]|uniref:Synthesis of sporulation killing factor A n=1 Tax=Peribacillus simplex TaxID=1478 RepID=A0AAN2PK62_9BACI|nr:MULTISPECIES: sporulation killing factor system radical SAM maturase [Bacillaceae]MCP1093165.1 sporulation killing factor system radical SAM maturase [Bacillaceae bacterium OS4b]MCF7623777.1 sporulation killing factor system radical SAM maturase [Peribacillus frigoritolerans]MCP1154324.1 sporulation killing factor system radical SAM maturase [Peribacillus frigoritolerans]MCT1390856.1 sporulation killing factor system radical SAM maturase [Peribacillus frigoritolerans]MEA3573739.1 sporulatio
MTNDLDLKYEPEFSLHLQPSGCFLLESRSMYYFRLSGVASELALILSKTRSIDKTAKIWGNIHNEEITSQHLIDQFNEHPFTSTWKEGILKNLRISGSTKSYLPISCTLQLTNGCNLSCAFCYASSGKRYTNELDTDQWLSVLQKLAINGVSDVTLTGGEARLAKGFKRILATASSLFTNVHLFSNGINWREDEIDLVTQLNNVVVQVSVDGTPDIHDRLRGRQGAYHETIHNVKKLTNSKIPTLIAMTINPSNYKSVEHVVEDAVLAGVSAFRAGLTLPVGRAKDSDFGLSDNQYNCVNTQLKKCIDKWGDRIILTDWNNEGNNGCTDFCTPGYLSWYIRADGTVTPCQIEGAELGNILEDSIHNIGAPDRLLYVRENSKSCHCISKVSLPCDKDLPFQ